MCVLKGIQHVGKNMTIFLDHFFKAGLAIAFESTLHSFSAPGKADPVRHFGAGAWAEKRSFFFQFGVAPAEHVLSTRETAVFTLCQVIAWVLGEYARLATIDGYTIEDIADLLTECIERPSVLLAFLSRGKNSRQLQITQSFGF